MTLKRRHAVVTLAVIAAVMLTVATMWGATTHNDFWTTAVPGTLTGVGTLALAAGTYALLRDGQQDRRQRDDDARRAIAAKVHPTTPGTQRMMATEIKGPVQGHSWRYQIDNGSDYPIRNVEAFLIAPEASIKDAQTKPAHPSGIARHAIPQVEAETKEWAWFEDLQWADGAHLSMTLNGLPTTAVAFTDTNGYRWLRHPDWTLSNITNSKEPAIEILAQRWRPRTQSAASSN